MSKTYTTGQSRGTGPRATVEKTLPLHVGRGPVPRHAAVIRTLAGETRSDARVASEGPRATMKNAALSRRARDRPSSSFALRKKPILFS